MREQPEILARGPGNVTDKGDGVKGVVDKGTE